MLDIWDIKFYPCLHPAFGFHSITSVSFKQIIWNVYTRSVTIKDRPSSILYITVYFSGVGGHSFSMDPFSHFLYTIHNLV